MSIFNCFKTSISFIRKDIVRALWVRTIITGNPTLCELEDTEATETTETAEFVEPSNEIKIRVEHPLEKCIQYMDSEAYKITYGDKPVWHVYVRNFKGGYPPKTRKNCWVGNKLNRASPCPMCRDQYLLAHYLNVKLLKQFISPYGGEVLDSKKTGVCQTQQQNLKVAIEKARNYGLLTFTVPHRVYDYSLYNKK